MAKPPFPLISDLFDTHIGETVFVCGYGASMQGFPWAAFSSRLVIGVNDVPKIYMPDWQIFVDSQLADIRYRFLKYTDRCKAIIAPEHAGRILRNHRHPMGNRFYQFIHKPGPTPKKLPQLMCNRTVAIAAIEFAWKLGFTTIYLLGIDCGSMGRDYYADGSPSKLSQSEEKDLNKICKVLEIRAKRFRKDVPTEGIRRARAFRFIMEPRHYDWYEDFYVLREALEKKGEVIGTTVGCNLKIINLSPISIVDAFDFGKASDVLGDDVRPWEEKWLSKATGPIKANH